MFESIQETPHRQKGALSPFNCISIPQSRVCGKEKPFRICKFLLRWCVLFHVFSEFFHFFRKKGLLFLLGFGIVYKSQGHARLAQLVEHLLDVQEVTGSSPVPSTRGKEPSTSVGGSFCFAGALRDGVVYSAWFNNSEFIKENIDETIFMFALFKCRKSDKGRN